MADPALGPYRAKRNFKRTPEPQGGASERNVGSRWVVQQHAARSMHYDFRLEANGVLISWAVPKGPSYDPATKRLAVKVEDHPLDYRSFEGVIPRANYGAGSVIVWDEGTYRNLTMRDGKVVPLPEAVEAGHLSVELEGKKLVGGWSLTRFKENNWTLVKRKDEHASKTRDIASEAPGSVKSGRTVQEVGQTTEARFVEPMLAQATPATRTAGSPLAGGPGEWLYEPKLDGLRCIAVRNGANVMLWSRNQLSFNARFPDIVTALSALPATNFVLDGEVVGLSDGRPSFGALQRGNAAALEYWTFDLPWLLGQDLRHLPIEERKKLLARTVQEDVCLKVVTALRGDGSRLFEQICEQGGEGLLAKRSGSAYREGRSGDWRKFKCGCRQEMVIGGFTEPRGTRTGFGALLLGYWESGELTYAGKVGTGFTQADLADLFQALVRIERPSSPFAGPTGERRARWVDPQLVAEVAFSNWTADGRLRHPSFIARRPDKAAGDVVREDPSGRATTA